MDVDLLGNLNPQQREAVLHFDSPLLIVAGAGSGKTRVITHKIAYLVMHKGIAPSRILGVTFTNRAAEEMKTRIEALTGVESRYFSVSTFHSFGLRILREAGNLFGPNWRVIDDDEQKKVFDRLAKVLLPHFTSDMRDAALRKINLAKMNLAYPNNPDLLQERGLAQAEIELFTAYHQHQKQNQIWDFEDLISLAVLLLQSAEPLARKYQERFRYLLIDEFQDINPNQYDLVKLIAGDGRNVSAVGDDDQAIYSWRGANVRFLHEYEKDFPGTRVIKLEQNYRSTQNILGFANNLIAFNRSRKGKKMWSESGSGSRVYQLFSYSKTDEAEKIAQLVLELKSKKSELFPLAVLYRINSQSLPLETTFLKRKIPFKIIKGLRFFERKEIKDCVALLRLAFNPDDDLAFLRLIDFLPLGIGEKSLAKLMQHSREHSVSLLSSLQQVQPEKLSPDSFFSRLLRYHPQVDVLPVAHILTELLELSGYSDILRGRNESERLLNIAELLDFIGKWQKDNPSETFTDLLDRMTLETISRGEETAEKVFLLTMHNAKGLEFPTVILAGINSTYMPFFLCRTSQELEEERRLFYVASTRAMDLLVVSSGAERSSPFLQAMNPELYVKTASPEAILEYEELPQAVAAEESSAKFLLHPIFGKGRIVEAISHDKLLVNFSERGNKIIDTAVVRVEYL